MLGDLLDGNPRFGGHGIRACQLDAPQVDQTEESLSAGGCSPKLGFGAEQRMNQGIAIKPKPPMRDNDPRAA